MQNTNAQFENLGDISGTDIYEIFNRTRFFYAYIYDELSGHKTTNWIGEVDGFILKTPSFALAIDGWNDKIYVNIFWSRWFGWREL